MLNNVNIMNLDKIKALCEAKGSRSQLIRKAGISRPTIDAILAGGDFKVSTLEKIAKAFNLPVSYFFDEEIGTNIRTAGRDYHEQHDEVFGNKSSQSNTANVSQSETIKLLQKQIIALEAHLKDKDQIIEMLKESKK